MYKVRVNFLEASNACLKVEQQSRKKISLGTGFIFFAVGLFSLMMFFRCQNAVAAPGLPPAPSVLSIQDGAEYTLPKPLITGVTINDTTVDVYIDEVFNGRAKVADHESGTASFAYYPFLNLKPGAHTLYLVARTKTEPVLRSVQSETINFKVVGYVTPTLFTPVFNLETTEFRPFIVGLARNDSGVRIYLDGELDGWFYVAADPSGTANFAYKPRTNLNLGIHRVQAIAFDKKNGKESKPSGTVIFDVKAPYPAPVLFKPVTAGAAAERPYIIGVVKSGSQVDVYVNGVRRAVLEALEHPSGTAGFAFRPDADLAFGLNVITAVAYSQDGKMSRFSQPISYQVGAVSEEATKASQEEEFVTKEEPELKPEKEEKPEVVLFPETGKEKESELKIEERKQLEELGVSAPLAGEGKVEVGEEEPSEREVVITEEAEETLTTVSGEKEPEEIEVGEEEGETNWSKIAGLIILAVLIIILIIQLLRKEGSKESKKGETLKLFEEERKEENGGAPEKEEVPVGEGEDDVSGVPPPPPPSSNLPF